MKNNSLILLYLKKACSISWVLVAGWMLAVFLLSSQPAIESTKLSQFTTSALVHGSEKMNIVVAQKQPVEEQRVTVLERTVRDVAHAVVFFILALLVANAFRQSGLRGLQAIAYTLLFCFLYAWIDEIHQHFVLGRSAEFIDLSLDIIGVILGTGLYNLVVLIIRKLRNPISL